MDAEFYKNIGDAVEFWKKESNNDILLGLYADYARDMGYYTAQAYEPLKPNAKSTCSPFAGCCQND